MLDLRRADAVGERAEGAMRRRVAVAADERHAGERKALLRPDDVNDALPPVELVEIFEAEELGVLGEIGDLLLALGVRVLLPAVGRWHVVIDDAQRLLRRAHLAAGEPQALEGLRARHFMHQMPVDIDEAGAVRLFVDEMIVPNLVAEGSGLGHGPVSCAILACGLFSRLQRKGKVASCDAFC